MQIWREGSDFVVPVLHDNQARFGYFIPDTCKLAEGFRHNEARFFGQLLKQRVFRV